MDTNRFNEITGRYGGLRAVVAGDFCLDRYFHVDPAIEEVSLETDLPAHQVERVRNQAGGAGNVLWNVADLGAAKVSAVGAIGDDGEGHELRPVLAGLGADVAGLISAAGRMTITFVKPTIYRPGEPPEEMSRLDLRDRTPTPPEVLGAVADNLRRAAAAADVVLLMEQVTEVERGVLAGPVRRAIAEAAAERPETVFLADSRCAASTFENVSVKVNRSELAAAAGEGSPERTAAAWAERLGRPVFVTMGPEGMLAAEPDGRVHREPGRRVEGPLDIVGAGDTVLAHLGMALAAGATPAEAVEIANAAASVTITKLATTGTATVGELADTLGL